MEPKIKRVYQHRQYEPVAGLSKTSEAQKQKVIDLYKSGKSQSFIETELKMTRKTIRTILKQAGIDRTKSQQWRIRWENSLDDTVFDEINEESAYWIGFLYADGYISGSEKSIELGLKVTDSRHLEKFKLFLKASNKIEICENNGSYNSDKKCRIRFGSDRIHNRLKELGFDNNKTWTAQPHPDLKNNRDFWRGVVDGDGSVSKKDNKISIHLCGTKFTIESFIEFVKINGIETNCKARTHGQPDLFQVVFEYQKGRQVADLLYKDAKIYLDRKYIRYLELNN